MSFGMYADEGYLQYIDSLKAKMNPYVRLVNKEKVMRKYDAWAKEYMAFNQYPQAVDVYQLALKDTFLLPDHHTFIALELASLYNNHLLMHQSALQLLEQYRFSENYLQPWIRTYCLAQTKIYMHQYDEALSLMDSLMVVLPEPEYDLYATRGYLHMSMSHYNLAAHDLEQAMNSTADSTDYYRILSNVAFVKAETNDCASAIEDISACMRYAQKIQHDIDATIYYRKRAQIHLLCGDSTAAAADYKTYWEREKMYIIDNFSTMTEQQRLDYWANRKPLISGAFQLGYHDAAFLADLAIFRHQAALLGVHDTARVQLQSRLNVDAKRIQNCLGEGEAAIEFVKFKKQKDWLYAALVICKEHVHFVSLCTENKFPIEAICSASAEDKNMLYQSGELASLVWSPILPYIQGKKEVWFAPDGILNMLAIEHMDFPDATKPNMHRLTSTGMLVNRTRHTKKQQVNALLIGGLNYDYMGENHDTPTAANQNGLRYWVNTRNHMAMFNYLPGSREEVDNIAPNIARWEKTYEESEEFLKSEFGLFNLVHLSTHGYSLNVSVTQPDDQWSDSVTTDNSLLGTGFALSGANISYRYPYREDGLLTGREICELDLRNVDFVVASACQSAQGKISDEGPAGLLRSLKLAGVGCVLATLWPVDDTATTLFMQYFYEAWQNGNECTKQQALVQAQQRLRQYGTEQPRTKRKFNASKLHGDYIQTQSAIYNDPYYWAPFILVDDIDAIK